MEEHTLKLRKNFVKESKAPIPVLESPYFEYFLALYEEDFGLDTAYKKFIERVQAVGVDMYADYHRKLAHIVPEHVKQLPAYTEFNTSDMQPYAKRFTLENATKKLYSPLNAGKQFIALDFKQANFHAILQTYPDLLEGATTYDAWLSTFDLGEHFTDDKYLRQIIFGNMNPKRQQTIEAYYLSKVLEHVHTHYDLSNTQVIMMSSDEFVVAYSEELENVIDATLSHFANDDTFKFIIKKDIFLLESLYENTGYVRKYVDGNFDFYCVPKDIHAQIYKHYKGIEDLHEFDLTFTLDKRLVKFLKPIVV